MLLLYSDFYLGDLSQNFGGELLPLDVVFWIPKDQGNDGNDALVINMAQA